MLRGLLPQYSAMFRGEPRRLPLVPARAGLTVRRPRRSTMCTPAIVSIVTRSAGRRMAIRRRHRESTGDDRRWLAARRERESWVVSVNDLSLWLARVASAMCARRLSLHSLESRYDATRAHRHQSTPLTNRRAGTTTRQNPKARHVARALPPPTLPAPRASSFPTIASGCRDAGILDTDDDGIPPARE